MGRTPTRSGRSRGDVVAVIDIGSNSGRVMVFERDIARHLRLLAGSRASLRLVHDVDASGALSEATMARTMEALRDFQAIATGAGARRIVAVATAAMRDASNGARFAERLRRELGIRIEIVGGLTEARYGFVGAVRGLAVSDGLLFDLGGGSVQITRFARRRLARSVSLPFGALRLSEKFLESDPPAAKQIRRLRDHVRSHLLSTELDGFTHDELVLASAIVRRAGDRHADVMSLGLVRDTLDVGAVERAAIILALADEIEARCPPGNRIAVDCTIGRRVTLSVPLLPSWLAKDLDRRFERAFGRSLVVRH